MSNTLNNRTLRARLWEECGGKCSYCGKSMNPFLDFAIDHKVATYNGGTDELSNFQGICRTCNAKKGARDNTGSILGQMTPEEAERHRMALAQSTAVSSLTLEIRDVKEIAERLGLEVFRLTPGRRFRVWNADLPQIRWHATQALDRIAQEDTGDGPHL